MPAFLLIFIRFARTIWSGLKDPEFRTLFISVLSLIAIGTLYYHNAEDWSWIDALYFTVITLTTIGYGDLSPTQPASKIFTIFFIFIGLGVFSAFILLLADRFLNERKPLSLQKEPTTPSQQEPNAAHSQTTVPPPDG